MSNESYYGVQKAMRALGTNSIDNAARICHSPSTFGLKQQLGVAATTCSYTDWIGSDLIVFIGSNVANNQPVAMKYLHKAKAAGTRVVVINPYREPGMERYWVPSIPESALFGTKVADRFFDVDVGGDVAFLTGTLKHMVERGWTDAAFLERHTSRLRPSSRRCSRPPTGSGSSAARAPAARTCSPSPSCCTRRAAAVFVWSMGITQHTHGEDNVRAIVNLALAKGFVGREKCGLMPIRGHSGVQGGAEMGAYATAYPGGLEPTAGERRARCREQWGFEVPVGPGLTAPEMVDAAGRGELDVLLAAGGNFLEVLPDPPLVERDLARIPLRVHMDIVLSPQMFVETGRHGRAAAGDHPLRGARRGDRDEHRAADHLLARDRRAARRGRAPRALGLRRAGRARAAGAGGQGALRVHGARCVTRSARVVPFYDGIQHLQRQGDSFQYGGPMLCAGWRFATPDGRARFAVVTPPPVPDDDGRLRLSTRRGKQFNSMVHERRDALTGALREAVLVAADDRLSVGLRDGDRVTLRSDHGRLEGTVLIAAVKPGNVQVHWPEGNTLLAANRRSQEAGIPDYNTWVELEPVTSASESA